jgi:hypothetical protein
LAIGKTSYFGSQAAPFLKQQWTAETGLQLAADFSVVPLSVLPVTFSLGIQMLYKFNNWYGSSITTGYIYPTLNSLASGITGGLFFRMNY